MSQTVEEVRTRFDGLVPSRAVLLVGKPKSFGVEVGDLQGTTIALGLGDLLVLERLARDPGTAVSAAISEVAEQTGAAVADLEHVVERLVEASMFVDGQTAAVYEQQPHADAQRIEPGRPPLDADERYLLFSPLVVRLTPEGFEHAGHDGEDAYLFSAEEIHVAGLLLGRPTITSAVESHRAAGGAPDLDVAAVVAWLVDEGFAQHEGPDAVASGVDMAMRAVLKRKNRLAKAVAKAIERHDEQEQGRERSGGGPRIKVHPVDTTGRALPLSLGVVISYAMSHEDGVLDADYQFVPSWLVNKSDIASFEPEPAVYLYSNYIWTHHHNLRASAAIKAQNPMGINVHGGPDSPKYDRDCDQYFRMNPHVDVVVHGEGEVTAAEMLKALAHAWDGLGPDDRPDLEPLRDVPGLSFRSGDGVVHNGSRDRLTDLNVIPSPFLNGLFDPFAEAGVSLGLLETNRGCPYGCTFCDWGSATASRIRKFDLERVFAEIEWYGKMGVDRIFLADANFGIFERDVEVAQKVAEVKAEYGVPLQFQTNYAKNTVKHLQKIVETLGDAGILTTGLLSLQSLDPATLKTVKRSNIKTEKYDALAQEFRKRGLPLFVDLMMGMPGATPAGFQADLQGCVDREISAKVYKTELLVNSPMNEPEYKAENDIKIAARDDELVKVTMAEGDAPRTALVISTSSYTRSEYDEMMGLRIAHLAGENLGILRHVSRFVKQEAGVDEVEFFRRARRDASADPDRWPMLFFGMRVVSFVGVAPGSWRWFIDEVRRYLTEEVGIAPSSALETVLAVQHALLPTRGRTLPIEVALDHDYPAWFADVIAQKDLGEIDWVSKVPHLRDYGPGVLHVDDTHQVCERALGDAIAESHLTAWELDAPVSRAMSYQHLTFSS